MLTAGERKWFAVHTQARRESDAAAFLQRRGFRAFYPFSRVTRYVGRVRRMREYEVPLLTRYIFVEAERQAISVINDTRIQNSGVAVVVHCGEEPEPIPVKVIDALMAITDEFEDEDEPGIRKWLVDQKRLAAYTRQIEEHWFKGKPGDRIVLADEAPFFGLVAELASIENLDKRGEISIWLNVLGARRVVALNARSVASVIARDRSKPALPVADVAGGDRRKSA